MEIKMHHLPIAGEPFNFSIDKGIGVTHIKVYVDKQVVFQDECDDPPCHELTMIPPDSSGSTLLVIATDTEGNKGTLEYVISESEEGLSKGIVSTAE